MKEQGTRVAASAKPKRYGKVLSLVAVVLILVCFAGGIYARYTQKEVIENNQVAAAPFYFTVDLLRDDEMSNVSKEYHLYGGGSKAITFSVWNHVDEYRVTQLKTDAGHPENDEKLTYTFGFACEGDADYTDYQVVQGTTPVTEGYFTGSAAAKQTYTLNMGEGYRDGTTLTLKITSTAPYEKTVSLVFHLHTTDADALYRVEDQKDDNVASLIIMANKKIDAGKILMDLSAVNGEANVLAVDMTDVDIWTWSGGVPVNPPALPAGELWFRTTIPVSVEMDAGESLEIRFFKKYPAKEYSTGTVGSGVENLPLEANGAGTYLIVFDNPEDSSGT